MTVSSTELPRIGVLGGMGPLASAEFMVKLVQATPAKRDQEHFPTTLDSSPQIPDRPNSLDGSGPDPFPAMIDVIRRLETVGCDLIAMPCNTVHHWYDRLTTQTDLPIVHIADAVGARLHELAPKAKRVGILGARVTCQLGIYSNRLGDAWDWVYPSEGALQMMVMPAVAAVKAGELSKGRSLFLAAMQELLDQNVDAVVLACTEIPVVLTQADVPLPIIDSTDALARYTVKRALAIMDDHATKGQQDLSATIYAPLE